MTGPRDVPDRPDLAFVRRRPAAGGAPAPARSLLDLGTPAAPAAPAPPRAAPPSPRDHVPRLAPAAPDLGWLRRRPPARRVVPAPAPRPAPPPAPRPSPPAPAAPPGVASAASVAAPSRPEAAPLRGLLTLRSSRPSVTIPAAQATNGPLRLHLTWSTLPTDRRSVQAGLRRSTDVHLGVLWETNDGHQGVVQSLGDSFLAPGWGSTLLRLGPRSETDGETVTVALNHVHTLKRLVAFAYAYSGEPEWDALAVQLTTELRGGVEVQLGLDAAPADAGVAALASVHRVGSELVLRREAAYLRGQQSAVAAAYGWDLPWASGRTVPRRPR